MKIKMYKNEMKINFKGETKKEITWLEFGNIDDLGKYLETIRKYRKVGLLCNELTRIEKPTKTSKYTISDFPLVWDCKDLDIWKK